MKEVPKSAWQRSRAMVGLAAKVASKEVGSRLRNLAASSESKTVQTLAARVEQAKLLAESLGRMKGALMKAGQLLSIDAGDLLPPEVTEVLAKLQSEAEPVDFAALREVVLADLGPEKLARFEGLGGVAAASASIGQVYRAHVDGAPVAVKIQYPGVAESIDSDLGLLEKLGQSMVALSGRKVDLGDFVNELRQVLHYEADYVRERGFIERFAAGLAHDPRFVVPATYPELSSKRVLTMSWEEGVRLGEWLRGAHSRETRTALGKAVLDAFVLELFTLGVVQTDPNFANFLVRESDSGPRLVLLDFGASVEFDAAFRTGYAKLLRAMASGDDARIIAEGIAFALLDARESAESKALFARMLATSVEPFAPHRQPFSFSDAGYTTRLRAAGEQLSRSLKYSPPPKRLIFLHRKLGGIFQLLKRLDVALDLTPYWDAMTGA